MSDLLSALKSSANALDVFQRALDVVQNNVTNASTPGYARQDIGIQSLPFQPNAGLPGGISAGEIVSARDQYAEQSVRRQLETLGAVEQKAQSLAGLELTFNVTSDAGIPAALSALLQSFSSWSVTPNSGASRQAVIDNARRLTQSFQQAAAGVAKSFGDTNRQIQQSVTHINDLAAKLRDYNAERLKGGIQDAGLDAEIHATLEELSEYTDFTATENSDGSFTVLLGGQSPLVIGSHQYPVSVSFSTAPNLPPTVPGGVPPARILDAQGGDITSHVSQGKLAALLEVRNAILPSLGGDAYQQGDLNLFAQNVADRVNQILTSGNISDGPPAVPGVPLFSYNAGSPTAIAQTLTLNGAITTDQLAAIDPGPPYVANGIALRLSALAAPQNAADKINGYSYAEFYGTLAARVGSESADARDKLDVQRQLLAQARSLRSQISGVSLDEEAVRMVEFQRAYQATAKMVTMLDELTRTTINLLP